MSTLFGTVAMHELRVLLCCSSEKEREKEKGKAGLLRGYAADSLCCRGHGKRRKARKLWRKRRKEGEKRRFLLKICDLQWDLQGYRSETL